MGSNYSENFASNLLTKWFLHYDLLFQIKLLSFSVRKFKIKQIWWQLSWLYFDFLKDLFLTIQIHGQVKRKWVNLWEQMRSTVKLRKSSMMFQEIFIICVIFNLNVHSISKKKVFCLKVSIYWRYSLCLCNIGTICTSPFADVL